MDNNFRENAFLNRSLGSENASLISTLVLAFAFSSSLIASVVGDTAGDLIQAGSMVLLIVYPFFCRKQFFYGWLPTGLKTSLVLLMISTFILAIYGSVDAFVPSQYRFAVLLKAGGTILTILALLSSARVFTYKEICNGLLLFAVAELLGCIALHSLGSDYNPNALAVRMSVCAMILLTLTKYRLFQITGLAVCVAFSLALQCRTSLVAFVGALAFMYVERSSRKNREMTLFCIFFGTCLLLLMLPTLTSALQRLAIENLGSDNFVAKFFLSDKSSSKIQTDVLDRNLIWEFSWEHIKEKPLLGYGLGTEKGVMGARSHNAFLSLVFEGGVVNLLAWIPIYILSLMRLFDKQLIRRIGDLPLFLLSNLLVGYMLLAGIVETSGLASVSTPINIIFIFLVVWLYSPRPRIRNI